MKKKILLFCQKWGILNLLASRFWQMLFLTLYKKILGSNITLKHSYKILDHQKKKIEDYNPQNATPMGGG